MVNAIAIIIRYSAAAWAFINIVSLTLIIVFVFEFCRHMVFNFKDSNLIELYENRKFKRI